MIAIWPDIAIHYPSTRSRFTPMPSTYVQSLLTVVHMPVFLAPILCTSSTHTQSKTWAQTHLATINLLKRPHHLHDPPLDIALAQTGRIGI